MNIFKLIIGITLGTILLTSCASVKPNQAAATNQEFATTAIDQIKESGIVVIFPTEHKKEKALVEFSKSKPSIQKDLDKLKTQRDIRLALWQNIKKEYTFSKVSMVPDSLLKSYIANPNQINAIGKDDDLIETSLGEIYVLYTDYGGFEVKQNGRFLPNPFPNKVPAAWGSSLRDFLGVQSEEKSIKRFFTELDSQLKTFYGLTKKDGN